MFNSKGEEHKVHRFICSVVVVDQRLFNCFLESTGVDDFFVYFFGTERGHAVSPQQSSDLFKCCNLHIFLSINFFIKVLKNFIEVETPHFVDSIFGDVEKIDSVILVDQPIREYS